MLTSKLCNDSYDDHYDLYGQDENTPTQNKSNSSVRIKLPYLKTCVVWRNTRMCVTSGKGGGILSWVISWRWCHVTDGHDEIFWKYMNMENKHSPLQDILYVTKSHTHCRFERCWSTYMMQGVNAWHKTAQVEKQARSYTIEHPESLNLILRKFMARRTTRNSEKKKKKISDRETSNKTK